MQVGTIWTIVGYAIIAGGLLIGSLIVHYGNKLNQEVSENKIIDQQKISESALRKDINSLKSAIAELQNKKGDELSAKFPSGYQLFGVAKNKIIPSDKSYFKDIKINWTTGKILEITADRIGIQLPTVTFPGNIIAEGNIVRIKNEEGATSSDAIALFGYKSYIKILKSHKNTVIAVIGYLK